MKLLVKFNLAFLALFPVALAVTGTLSQRLLRQNAREEVVMHARIMMESARASRKYTSTKIQPLLAPQMGEVFLPQSVPAFGATEQFAELQKTFPEYSYKEATLNPTNPRDRATDWEADIVYQFRQRGGSELIGERATPMGPSMFLASPIQITQESCLACHNTAETAPKSVVAKYGNGNGFGWTMGEIIGAQVVSVPMTVPIQKADRVFRVFMISMAAVLGGLFLIFNIMLTVMVVRPVSKLARISDQVSLGNLEAEEFQGRSRDEIGTLAQSFSRMRKSLTRALKMID